MTTPAEPLPHVTRGLRRALYVLAGLCFVFLGFLGAVLPGLPTTPFLLLASFFFVRSSPRLHRWLLSSRLFGGFLRDWQQHRGVRPQVKLVALTIIPLVVTASLLSGRLSWPLASAVVVLALIGVTVVARLPLVREPAGEAGPPAPGRGPECRALADEAARL